MKIQKKFIIQMFIFTIIVMSSCKVFATNLEDYGEMIDTLEETYVAPKIKREVTNPFKLVSMLGATVDTKYSLKDVIPANMVIKNQQQTNFSWAFASIGALESSLALKDYKNGKSPVVYDFSERHMEYFTSKTFKDGINKNGFNREVGDKNVSFWMATSYMTNGYGAVLEKDMPFENNQNKIELKQIENKKVNAQINDTIMLLEEVQGSDKNQLIQRIKEIVKNYGGVDTFIHGVSNTDDTYYNNKTGALYCDDSEKYARDHYALIVGWDDDYSKNNFVSNKMPQNNGAWIVRDSLGTGIGDNGYIYVSYEDVNIYHRLGGIIDAQTDITYENIYQYDQFAPTGTVCKLKKNKIYLATMFDKKTSDTEYLTQVSIYAPEKYTCKVYVNPNGTSKSKEDFQEMKLKTGDTISFEAGYHTIEFLNPIQITGSNFVVMIEAQGDQKDGITVEMEFNDAQNVNGLNTKPWLNDVSIESGKCFYATEDNLNSNTWIDTSTMKENSKGKISNFDTTIKAFTRSTIESNILQGIEITTSPSKTEYFAGENFDRIGMVVKAKYSNGTSKEITDYTIANGTNLVEGQTSITLEYNGKTVKQAITVKKKTSEPVEKKITSISVKNRPTKIEYIQNKEELDLTGGVIEVTYNDNSKEDILMTSKEITASGFNNKILGKNTITVKYQEKTTQFDVEIKKEKINIAILQDIKIITPPNKTEYFVGENFDKTGMNVKAIYSNGIAKDVSDYTIIDGTNLVDGQKSVTIEYGGKIASQAITVKVKTLPVEKIITSISVKTMPIKTEYIQNKEELDLTGGVIDVTYNDNSKEDILMTSKEIAASGFNNKTLGKNTITVKYQEKTTQFDIEIKKDVTQNDGVRGPQNSKFDNMQVNISKMKAYYFTDTSKKEYTIISVDINNITISSSNDKMEYYYYLSSNPQESNIKDWIKIDDIKKTNNKLSFEINTLNCLNYNEISKANAVYLYVKEVAILNDLKQDIMTSPAKLEVKNINIEEYIDGKKKSNVNSETIVNPASKNDKTLAPEILPKAGRYVGVITFAFVVLIVLGIFLYKKYKNIQLK